MLSYLFSNMFFFRAPICIAFEEVLKEGGPRIDGIFVVLQGDEKEALLNRPALLDSSVRGALIWKFNSQSGIVHRSSWP